MKKLIIGFFYLISILNVYSQKAPSGIAYQAVAIKDGNISFAGQNATEFNWSNKMIQVRFSIFEKYPSGSIQYSEVHKTQTDDYGVFNLIIGQGQSISGVFDNIPWEFGTAHLQVEIDFENNNTFKITSFERFWSVPYAFVTRKLKGLNTNTDSALNALNGKFSYLINRDKDTVIGNEGGNGISYKSLDSLNQVLKAQIAKLKLSDKDTVIGNEWQKLTRVKDTLILSDGGGKVLINVSGISYKTLDSLNGSLIKKIDALKIADKDTVLGNEWQKLTRINDTLFLSDGGGKIALLDEDPKNELQKITFSNDTLFLSNGGGFVKLNLNGNPTNLSTGLFNQASLQLNAKYEGPMKSNGPWSVSGIYSINANWVPTSMPSGGSDPYYPDCVINSNDSFFFFDNGAGSDCISSYLYDSKNRYFAGPVLDITCPLNSAKKSWDLKTLNSDNTKKCFFWLSSASGLNIYYPNLNTHYTSAGASVSTTNFNWLASISLANNKFFASYKKDSTIFLAVNDITGDVIVYKYNFISDKKKQLYNTGYNYTNNGLLQTRFNDPSARCNVMIDSFLVFPFNGKNYTGELINGSYLFGYYIFNYYTGKKDTIVCGNNTDIKYTNAFEKNYLLINKDHELINLRSKKTVALNFNSDVKKLNIPSKFFLDSYLYFYNKKLFFLKSPSVGQYQSFMYYY